MFARFCRGLLRNLLGRRGVEAFWRVDGWVGIGGRCSRSEGGNFVDWEGSGRMG